MTNIITYSVKLAETHQLLNKYIVPSRAAEFLKWKDDGYNADWKHISTPLTQIATGLDLLRDAFDLVDTIADNLKNANAEKVDAWTWRQIERNLEFLHYSEPDLFRNSVLLSADITTKNVYNSRENDEELENMCRTYLDHTPEIINARRELFGYSTRTDFTINLFTMSNWLEREEAAEDDLRYDIHNTGAGESLIITSLTMACDSAFSIIAGAQRFYNRYDDTSEAVSHYFEASGDTKAHEMAAYLVAVSDWLRSCSVQNESLIIQPENTPERSNLCDVLNADTTNPIAAAGIAKLANVLLQNPNTKPQDIHNAIDSITGDIILGEDPENAWGVVQLPF